MAIKIKPSHKGLLHRRLNIPEGKPIPLNTLLRAKHAKSAEERKEANFAVNARKFKH